MAILFESGILGRLFGSTYSKIDTLPIDIVLSEKQSERSLVTDKPTEDGDVKTLGTVILPTSLSISGIFNDDHWGSQTWADKKEKLDTLRKSQAPFTISISLGTFEQMVFESVDYDRGNVSKGGLFFSATLRRITTLTGRTVPLPVNLRKNGKAVDTGKKQPITQTAEEITRTRKTLAAYLKDAVFGE